MGTLSDLPDEPPAKMGKEQLGKLNALLERSGLDADDFARVERVKVWQGFMKDDDGEAEVVDLAGMTLVPHWVDGPEWPVVQPAKPTVVRYRKSSAQRTTARTTVVLPDTQIGFRRYEDGTLDPTHDERAIACALEIARELDPWRIVLLGDTMDLSQWSSKFLIQPEFVFTTQPAVDRAHLLLADCRSIVGEDGHVVLLEGNHDDRVAISIAKNAMEALRLRQANAPESWPVLSIPNLLRTDELGVEYVGGYPAGKVKLAEAHGRQSPLYARHGVGAGNVQKDAKSMGQSFVQGHGHHLSVHAETYEYDERAIDVEVWSLGCLCRVDRAVPGTFSGNHAKGQPVAGVDSWQHAVGVVTEYEGGGWDVTAIRIRDGRAWVGGKTIEVPA
jgi:hypothetical protein